MERNFCECGSIIQSVQKTKSDSQICGAEEEETRGAVDTRGKSDTPPYTIYGSLPRLLGRRVARSLCWRFRQMSPGSDFIDDSGKAGKCRQIYFLLCSFAF